MEPDRHYPSRTTSSSPTSRSPIANTGYALDGTVADIDDPLDKLVGMFAAIEELTTSPECSAVPSRAPPPSSHRDHPGHQVASAHKTTVRDRFAQLAAEAGLRRPEKLADQLLLLMDGAWAPHAMYGPTTRQSA